MKQNPIKKYRKEVSGDVNNLNIDDVFNFMELYFNKSGILFSHLYNSYNKFMDEDIKTFLESGEHVFSEVFEDGFTYKYKFKYENVMIKPPSMDNDNEAMFPSDARTKSSMYSGKLIARVSQIQEKINVSTGEKTTRVIGEPEDKVPIANLPIMLKSNYCSLMIYKNLDKTECKYDPGGYFITGGSEKVIIPQDCMAGNKPIVSIKKDAGVEVYQVQVNSKSYKPHGIAQPIMIKLKKNNILIVKVPILSEVPVMILIKALGIDNDRDIVNYITHDPNDDNMTDLIRFSLESCKDDKNKPIQSREEAINYLLNKIRVVKKYTESSSPEIRYQQRKMHLLSLLQFGFIPHMESTLIEKGIYLCLMINKLLRCVLGRIPKDDKDSYVNKRIDLPGNLLEELFRQFYKKMLNECTKTFRKRNTNHQEPINIVNQIKPNTIEQGLKTALSTGSWIRRKGVAQMLYRYTYLMTISFLRRIDAPSGDQSTSKLRDPRHLHPSSMRWMCPTQTPEHAKAGLSKSLSIIGSITVMQMSQLGLIKKYFRELLEKNLMCKTCDVPSIDIGLYVKVYINGELVGLTLKPNEIYKEIKTRKLHNTFSPYISVVWNILEGDIRVYCDGGRGFAPAIVVENNVIKLTKEHLLTISLNKASKHNKITSWDEFMIKNPGVIEYIDMEEMPYLMISDLISNVEKMRLKMIKSLDETHNVKNEIIVNRYDDMTFVKYTHCDFHPSFMFGEIISNIPWCNHNETTRSIFWFNQGKQGMGLYATNYRDRADISYILYHPQKPLINTRTSKFVHSDILPSGENAIVAIACYYGYNKEDSGVISRGAIDRGLFRTTTLRKYTSVIGKQQSTAQDEIFMKPDPNKVTGKSKDSTAYAKVNDKGYAPEETVINYNDIIIAKLSPIQPVYSDITKKEIKNLKDNSEIYKSLAEGIVDKVWDDIYTNDGNKMIKMRVRSQRIPNVADKFCSRHGQKLTIGIKYNDSDNMFSESGLQPDIILNPNAIPKRMTMAQLMEPLFGTLCAIEGEEGDGTPFNDIDIEYIQNKLESLGYDKNGEEWMYNGMTGEKMKTKIFIGPAYYQRLKHLVEDKIHCLTFDHEILTNEGWKYVTELNDSHTVKTLNNGYVKPIILLYPEHEGDIYTIMNTRINIAVTEEHRMYIKEDNETEYKLMPIKSLIGKTVKYLNDYEEIFVEHDKHMTIETNVKVPVFCLQVEGELFYVRRCGLEVWTGNSRSTGPTSNLTRQPPEGRSRDGGLRLGEMERDSLLGHGASIFLKEKMLDSSDAYTTYVCGRCGLFCQRYYRQDSTKYISNKDIFFCASCKNYTEVGKVILPYAFKLLIQELLSMNIASRIRYE